MTMIYMSIMRHTLAAGVVLGWTSASPAPAAAASRHHFAADIGDQRLVLPAPWADEDDPADAAYRAAREAMNANDFTKAARLFDEISSRYPTSAYAGDAYYWRAFSLYRLGDEDDLRAALDALRTQKAKFPKAKTIGDGEALAVRVRGALAQRGDASAAEDVSKRAQSSANCTRGNGEGDDLRAAAINSLLQMDSRSAVPILKDILAKRDACSTWLRKKAVFMLSQHRTSDTEDLMMDVVRNDPSRDVRQDAVFWLGQVQTAKAEALLIDIATTAKEPDMRKKALFALTQQQMPRGRALIRKLADDGSTPAGVRKDAIWQLGQQPSQENSDALRALFAKNKDDHELASAIMFSLSQMRGYGNDRWLLNIGTDRSVPEDTRKKAVWCAGQAGIPGSELISLYDRLTDRAVKEHLIWVMSDAHDRGALDKLIDIAKTDKDVEMRKKALFWLGQKNDPRVRQLLIDIIKGE